MDLGLDGVEVMLTLQTRNPDHRHQVLAALTGTGYRVDQVR